MDESESTHLRRLRRLRQSADTAAGVNAFFASIVTGIGFVLLREHDGSSDALLSAVVLGLVAITLFVAAYGQARWAARGTASGTRATLIAFAGYGIGATGFLASMTENFTDREHLGNALLGAAVVGSVPFLGNVFARTLPANPDWSAEPPRRVRSSFLGLFVGLLVMAAIAVVPPLPRGGMSSTNESAAIGSLRALAIAQEQFKQQNVVDQDADGMGEYGFLQELAGTGEVRDSKLIMSTSPFIARILGDTNPQGLSQKSGYYYVVYLPTADGGADARNPNWNAPTRESSYGKNDSTPIPAYPSDAKAADVQETRWCAYAWPINRGQSGTRAFFVDHAGEVYASPNNTNPYDGTENTPAPEGAYEIGSGRDLAGGVGLAASGLTSNDGNTWVPAGN